MSFRCLSSHTAGSFPALASWNPIAGFILLIILIFVFIIIFYPKIVPEEVVFHFLGVADRAAL